MRQSFPEVIDPVRLARGHDVVIDGADLRTGVLVFDETERGHGYMAPISKIQIEDYIARIAKSAKESKLNTL
jgi:hypothetical protein